MSNVVHLKWGEQPRDGDIYVLITRYGRIRGEDYAVKSSVELELAHARNAADEYFASLASALREAEHVADREGAGVIYVRMP